ncbi:DUF3710 domain-containing protein [Nocardia cyriacigeorgica]|uniref:Protein of uncharacterized function (DUF3710) n=2 Tax=Nocardia cyriacigeorgica TaxID=135487 RepID=A0A4U8W182_9NOCA|nr:DUF3710 domain-containing protein [Nocardia cyriacigeorgica]MBF6158475.1 DUF3710 domain-containing protein [Nocardia cyriacigeorgica]MBF6197837.1 DUF3710 domain-containing protein [Nocardia cyriacigeorgica]VFA98569.1 Protein of uncharacterised function (DUF3710) [Nocardia cyriacigeorgica]
MFGKKKSTRRDRSVDDDHYDESGDYAEFDGDEYDTDEYPEYSDDFADAIAEDDYDYDDDSDYRRAEHAAPDDDEPPATGPYDYEEVAELLESVADQRLDLGSVILPVPPGGQLQVEMTPEGTPQAVHLATEHGRITVAAYAAPKSPGQWRTVASDLADSLRKDGAKVAIETGPWGREIFAVTEGADLRFIGVDGYRWMVRLVAAGPSGAADADTPLVTAARAILAETVIRRGTDPLPVREPLPVVLPQELADQLAAAHQQQIQAQQQAIAAQQQALAAQQGTPGVVPGIAPGAGRPVMPDQPRRGADGSAMQQLGRN